ncbi:MAG: hypothetical protein K1X44_02710 [Alphaproteobacteria bacterium]|nr:hypothetical protein [Alphaproteobacteria bacterium]
MFNFLWRNRRNANEIAIGQKYRRRDVPLVVWEVSSIFTGTDGIAYVSVFRTDDATMRKTLAKSALENTENYILLNKTS